MLDINDTIAAIASAPGGAARGIVRLSGPRVIDCLASLFAGPSVNTLRHPARRHDVLRLGASLGDVPCDVYLWPDCRSYTLQPSAEIHLPGSPPLLQAALTQVCRAGARIADPGEFTLRAFLAGRLDLTQAEAVLGVIDATAQQELEAALAQLAGGIAAPLHALRGQLLDLLAHLEAGLDFVDEDIEFISSAELQASLAEIGQRIVALLEQLRSRQAASDAWRIVLTGAPNAGKSSLLNALAGEDAALVSPIAGTTRDYITRELSIAGWRCSMTDTAGLAGASALPDAAAEAHALHLVDDAHLVLHCIDATTADERVWPSPNSRGRTLRVLTKCDLVAAAPARSTRNRFIATSARTGEGLPWLCDTIARELHQILEESSHGVAGTAARCCDSLRSASEALDRARRLASLQGGEELISAELRLALDDLGNVVGAVYTDDILDRIFSRFCIGK